MSGYIGNIPVPQATQTRQSFTATASQTTFNTAGYSPGYIDVFLNGVKLAPADYTATNGSDVVLAVGAASGDILETVAYEIFQVLDQDFTGDFTVDGSTFVVDSTNDRVGVGTASPSTTLDLVGNWVSNTGQLSIDTPSGETYSGLAILNNGTPKGFLYHDNSAGTLDLQTYTTDALRFKTNNAEAMRINSNGNVLINNTTDYGAATLYLTQSADNKGVGVVDSALTYTTFLRSNASGSILSNNATKPIIFETGSNERMRIDSSGNVGIGTTSPAGKLTLKAGDNTYAGGFRLEGVDETTALAITHVNGDNFFSGNATDDHLVLTGSGNVGIGTTSPSAPIQAKKSTTGVETILDLTASTGAYNRGPAVDFSADWSGEYTLSRIHSINQGIGAGYAASLIFSTNGGSPGTLSEAMRIDSSGNLLVGTSSDYAENVQAAFYGASNGGIALASGTSGLSRLMFADGVAGTAGAYVGSIIYSHADDTMRFNVNGGTERMRILAGGGITFNGDTAAANALDDYEEGTWVPTYTATGGGSYNLLQNPAKYTKIGNLVTVTWWSQFNNPTGTLSGLLNMGGLPFASNGSTRASAAVRLYGWNSGSYIISNYTSGGNNINWQYYPSGMSGIAVNVPASWVDSYGDEIGGTLTYQIA